MTSQAGTPNRCSDGLADAETYRMALTLVRQFGDRATITALSRAELRLRAGDYAASGRWLRVAATVVRLTDPSPAPSGARH